MTVLKKKARPKEETREEKKERKISLHKYTLSGRKSSAIALINALLLAMIFGIGILKKGNAGIYVGFFMVIVLILAIIGFVIGINSFKEENKFLRYTYLGTISNAVIWIGILGIYIIYI